MTRPPVDLSVWVPRGVEVRAGAFAREVVAAVEPATWARARSLAWAASRICDFALSLGHEPDPAVVLSGAFIERFMASGTPGWSGAARRCARTNLYFLARRSAPGPTPPPLSRERAKAPYCESELAAYLALADAQPTARRRWRASGLIALGAGAGLIGADLRLVSGHDVVERSGGVVVSVKGARPRVVPVRRELAARALSAAAQAAGSGFIVGGAAPTRRNVTSPLIASLAKGPDLERLSLARLRATWVARCAEDIGLATFLAAAGLRCSQRLGDVVAELDPGDEERAVALLGGR